MFYIYIYINDIIIKIFHIYIYIHTDMYRERKKYFLKKAYIYKTISMYI